MLIAGSLCLVVAGVVAFLGVWALTRPRSADPAEQAKRMLAPLQLVAAGILAVGAIVAVITDSPAVGAISLAIGLIGAVGIVAAGSWQSARFAVEQANREVGSGCSSGGCGSCSRSCS